MCARSSRAPLRAIGIAVLAFCRIAAAASPEGGDLTKALAQTVASLFSMTIKDYYVASRWDRPDTANHVEFQTTMPFKAWNQENLIRLSIPFRTHSELGPGLSDVRLFDLVMFEAGFGTWGIGPSFNLGINKGPGVDSFQAGPAATVLYNASKTFSFGFLSQNFFNEQVSISTLQPIFVYSPGEVWTISLGELPLVYNWRKDEFAVFSLGIQVGALATIGTQKARFFVNPQYNTKSNSQLYQWTIATGVTLPLTPVTP